MLGTVWPDGRLDPYHDDMLIVRVLPTAGPLLGRRGSDLARSPERAIGLAALQRYEHEERLHRIVPMMQGRAGQRTGGHPGMLRTAVHLATKHFRREHPHTGSMLVHLRDARHRRHLHRMLSRDPNVASVSRVAARYLWAAGDLEKAVVAALPPQRMWNHARIRLDEARALKGFRQADAVRVAILDTGVDRRHPALRGRIHDYVHRYHAHEPIVVSDRDIVGHGTHVAGVIAASPNAPPLVSGICTCTLTVFKVFGDDAAWEPASGCRAYAVDPVLYRLALGECLHRRIQVVNLSLGGPAPADPHEAALLAALQSRGTVVVAAMGNALQHRRRKTYPAAEKGVIAVGAVDSYDTVASFSCRGRHIALTAPGVEIWSTLPTYPGQVCFFGSKPGSRNTHYDGWLGTSAACPHVTAAVALLIARRGPLAPAEVRRRLMKSADRVPGMHGKAFDADYGAGRLNLRNLLGGQP